MKSSQINTGSSSVFALLQFVWYPYSQEIIICFVI